MRKIDQPPQPIQPFVPSPEQANAGLNTPVLQPTPDDHSYLNALMEALRRAMPSMPSD